MRDIPIGACIIRLWHDHFFEIVYAEPDKTVPSAPNFRPQDITTAERLGYGQGLDAVLPCWQAHDMLHQWIAVQEGLDYSPTLHSVAFGYKLPKGIIPAEEDRVMALQQLLNGVPADPGAVAQLVGRTGQSQGALVDAARAFLATVWH